MCRKHRENLHIQNDADVYSRDRSQANDKKVYDIINLVYDFF